METGALVSDTYDTIYIGTDAPLDDLKLLQKILDAGTVAIVGMFETYCYLGCDSDLFIDGRLYEPDEVIAVLQKYGYHYEK